MLNGVIRANIALGGISIVGESGGGERVWRRGEQQPDRARRRPGPGKGISLSANPGGGAVANQVALNLVLASADDGIYVDNPGAPNPNVFRQNTSILNQGCDANDVSASPNVWEQNRFGTACGIATASK